MNLNLEGSAFLTSSWGSHISGPWHTLSGEVFNQMEVYSSLSSNLEADPPGSLESTADPILTSLLLQFSEWSPPWRSLYNLRWILENQPICALSQQQQGEGKNNVPTSQTSSSEKFPCSLSPSVWSLDHTQAKRTWHLDFFPLKKEKRLGSWMSVSSLQLACCFETLRRRSTALVAPLRQQFPQGGKSQTPPCLV